MNSNILVSTKSETTLSFKGVTLLYLLGLSRSTELCWIVNVNREVGSVWL